MTKPDPVAFIRTNTVPDATALVPEIALHLATEITPDGRDALLRLVAHPGRDEVAAISLEGLSPEAVQAFPAAPLVYPDHSTALNALGDLVGKTPHWVAGFY